MKSLMLLGLASLLSWGTVSAQHIVTYPKPSVATQDDGDIVSLSYKMPPATFYTSAMLPDAHSRLQWRIGGYALLPAYSAPEFNVTAQKFNRETGKIEDIDGMPEGISWKTGLFANPSDLGSSANLAFSPEGGGVPYTGPYLLSQCLSYLPYLQGENEMFAYTSYLTPNTTNAVSSFYAGYGGSFYMTDAEIRASLKAWADGGYRIYEGDHPNMFTYGQQYTGNHPLAYVPAGAMWTCYLLPDIFNFGINPDIYSQAHVKLWNENADEYPATVDAMSSKWNRGGYTDIKVKGYADVIEKPLSPYSLSRIWLGCWARCEAGAALTATIYELNADGSLGEAIATASHTYTDATDDSHGVEYDASKHYYGDFHIVTHYKLVEFDFDGPILVDKAVAVVVSGMDAPGFKGFCPQPLFYSYSPVTDDMSVEAKATASLRNNTIPSTARVLADGKLNGETFADRLIANDFHYQKGFDETSRKYTDNEFVACTQLGFYYDVEYPYLQADALGEDALERADVYDVNLTDATSEAKIRVLTSAPVAVAAEADATAIPQGITATMSEGWPEWLTVSYPRASAEDVAAIRKAYGRASGEPLFFYVDIKPLEEAKTEYFTGSLTLTYKGCAQTFNVTYHPAKPITITADAGQRLYCRVGNSVNVTATLGEGESAFGEILWSIHTDKDCMNAAHESMALCESASPQGIVHSSTVKFSPLKEGTYYLKARSTHQDGLTEISDVVEIVTGQKVCGIEEINRDAEGGAVIFDMTGRRISRVTSPGIYIVNGEKAMVK